MVRCYAGPKNLLDSYATAQLPKYVDPSRFTDAEPCQAFRPANANKRSTVGAEIKTNVTVPDSSYAFAIVSPYILCHGRSLAAALRFVSRTLEVP